MPARARCRRPASRFSSGRCAQRDHVRVLEQQELIADQSLLAIGRERCCNSSALA
jgi:hypothetical protein